MGKVAAIAAALFLSGCATTIQDQLTFCDGAEPLRPSSGETARLSDSLVSQIREHNQLGATACGWSP